MIDSFSSDKSYVTSITTNIKHRVRPTGSEHQGQTSISDPDQNLGFTCIFSSDKQEYKNLTFVSGTE